MKNRVGLGFDVHPFGDAPPLVLGGVDTDDAALVEANGGTVVVVEGERRNLKLTLAADLELAEALLDGARP